MHRLVVFLLAALDAVVVVASALLVVLAPLAVLWFTALGGAADWSALWPTGASIWMLGNLVPLTIALPETLTVALAIPADAATFALSLAPLAFAGFTVVFGVRSGVRAARAGSWISGFLSGTVVVGVLATGVSLTSNNDIASHSLWQAIVAPTALYAAALLTGGVVAAWRRGDDFLIDRIHDANDKLDAPWPHVVPLIARGAAIAVVTVVGAGALLVAIAVLMRGDRIVALFQASHVDALGATLLTIAHLAYLPTLIGWAIAWVAGPGFALGTGTAVSPAGTQVGVVPGIPLLGAVPEHSEPWLLVLVLVPIAAGALAGWVCRSALARAGADRRTSPRLLIAVGIAALAGAAGALIAAATSGSAGPGSLEHVGPQPGPVALALAVEVFVGAAILLLSPRGSQSSGEVVEQEEMVDASAPLFATVGAAAPGSLSAGIVRATVVIPSAEPSIEVAPAQVAETSDEHVTAQIAELAIELPTDPSDQPNKKPSKKQRVKAKKTQSAQAHEEQQTIPANDELRDQGRPSGMPSWPPVD